MTEIKVKQVTRVIKVQVSGRRGPAGLSGVTGPPGPAGLGVPAGGSTGQGLIKDSGSDYDTSWQSVVASVNGSSGTVVLTQDEIADGATYRQFSNTEKTKLGTVAVGATSNSTDSFLLTRSNHTGTQTIATVADLQTSLDAKEPTVPVGTTSQYYRGDKTFQTLSKATIGLSNVDNTSDSAKPISSATQTALDAKLDDSQKGAANGLAELDSSGFVVSAQLPSYVDAVVEVANFASLPDPGETSKIYYTLDTNLTYRWSGTVYVEVSASLALGETSSTAFRGDRGKVAYDHTAIVSGNPHAVTKTEVGLGSVDNTSDIDKPTSNATQIALDTKSPTTHNHNLNDLSEKSYISLTDKPTIPSAHSELTGIGTNTHAQIDTHLASTANPHAVTKSQVGLANVDNTSDLNKPVSTAIQTALNAKATDANVVHLTGTEILTGAKTFNTGTFFDKGNQVFNVKSYGAVGDGTTDDSTAINNTITAANAVGGGVVFFPKGTYLCGSRIVPKSYVTLRGVGYGSQIKRSIHDQIIVMVNGALDWFTVEKLRFSGAVNEFPTTPRRTRTVSGPGASFAIYLRGNQDPGTPGAGAISNFTLQNCTIENTTELPILIAGVTGVVRVVDNNFINNKDPGFIFNDEVIFNSNHCYMGADNGVSLSRGNRKITCTGNTIENCAFEGIFCAGFDIAIDGNIANIGPTNLTISGNTVKNVGRNCIFLDSAPKIGTVSGNTVEQGYFRGASGSTTITAASNGAVLPQATINVVETLGFNPSGGTFTLNGESITYTGLTDTSFTGASGGTSTLSTGDTVSSFKTDIASTGIYVAGYPFPYSSPTAYAEDLQITGNVVKKAGRAGIEVWASRRIKIDSNLLVDIGTQFKADGTTAVASNDVTSNVGILIHSANSTYITVSNNKVIDSRGTPFCNYAIVPYTSIPATYSYSNNQMINCRNAYNLIDYTPDDRIFQGGAAIVTAKGLNDPHNNRVLTITDNASTAPNFLNIQGSIAGQAVALTAQSFTETTIPLTFGSKGAATLAFRPGGDLVTAIQFRKADNVSANSVVNIDTTNARVGINTISPASELHVVGTIRATDMLITNPLPIANGGTGQANLTSLALTTPKIINGINDINGARLITLTATTAAVNYLSLQNSITGQNVALAAEGTDTDVGLTIRGRGAGTVVMRTATNTIVAFQVRKADNTTVVFNVDNTNNRVGINTAAPASDLHVVGTTRSTDLLLTNPLGTAYGGTGQANLTSLPLTTPRITNGINDVNGARSITITPTASAVNYITVQNSIAGQPVALAAAGSDTDIGITFRSQGAGSVGFRPSTDNITAAQFRAADNSTIILNVDSTNLRVGIGNAAPGSTLDVTGKITAQTLKMTTSPTIGYVLTATDGAGNMTWQAPAAGADATTGSKGIVQLTNDLGGTATAPTVIATHLTSALPLAQGGTAATSASAARTSLGLVIGTDVEAHDADLTTIAGLSPTNDDVIQRKSGAWTNRTMAQVKTDLALTKSDVGLSLVDNLSLTTHEADTTNVHGITDTTTLYRSGGTDVAIADGGTGASTASAGFNALSPLTTAGDILYGGASGAGTRLAAGTSSQVLIGGSTPAWGAVALTTMVTGTLPVANGGIGQTSLTSLPLTTPQVTNGINDSAGNRVVTFTAVASAVSSLTVQNAATGGNIALGVTSTDTNASMTIRSKGNGTIVFRPETDTIVASQWRKADNTTVVMDVDSTNSRVGIGTSAPTRTLDVVGITRTRSLVGNSGSVPTPTAGTGAGTSPSGLLVTGTDLAGTIAVTTGTACAGSATVLTMAFGTTFPNAPYIVITPGNSAAAVRSGTSQVYVDSATVTSSDFALKVGSTALTDSTAYVWYYHVIG